jgi:hypothetical protein
MKIEYATIRKTAQFRHDRHRSDHSIRSRTLSSARWWFGCLSRDNRSIVQHMHESCGHVHRVSGTCFHYSHTAKLVTNAVFLFCYWSQLGGSKAYDWPLG